MSNGCLHGGLSVFVGVFDCCCLLLLVVVVMHRWTQLDSYEINRVANSLLMLAVWTHARENKRFTVKLVRRIVSNWIACFRIKLRDWLRADIELRECVLSAVHFTALLRGSCGQSPVAGDKKGCQTKIAGGAGSKVSSCAHELDTFHTLKLSVTNTAGN